MATQQQRGSVIQRIEGNDAADRNVVVRRLLPGFALSGLLHAVFMGLFVVLTTFFEDNTPPVVADPLPAIETTVEDPVEDDIDLTNEDFGFDPDLKAAVDVERELLESVPTPTEPDEPIGIAPLETFEGGILLRTPPGAPTSELSGPTEPKIESSPAPGGLGVDFTVPGMRGRTGVSKNELIKAGGGNTLSEAAVARGLAWLARQQKAGGDWEFDGSSRSERIASTGMALLPFLAAGQTHKAGDYKKNVEAGIVYLINDQNLSGGFKSTKNMYSIGIATMALAEAYGMTRDPILKRHAQAAISFLVHAQHADGSWGYAANTSGDTSIVGWQLQALKSGKLANLIVPDATIDRARAFLVSVSSDGESQYGYREPGGRPSLNAVGLLCRVYMDRWGPRSPSLAKGVENLLKLPPVKGRFDMYYYYYATQVVHFFGGPDWHKTWNPQMRDWLISLQEKKPGPDSGSWGKDEGSIGSHCGRLGTTCLCLLTLEVYYRYLPLYQRDTGGLKELER